MKKIIKYLKVTGFLMLTLLFAGCQEEFVEVIEPDSKEAFTASDTLRSLIIKVSLKDGSFDNIIDNCSAISIKFPYRVQVRDEIITIGSEDDLEDLEDDYSESGPPILLDFPVTVIFSDYSEAILSNRGDLQQLIKDCNDEAGDEDDDIECIDFIYPIEISLYNTEFQKPDYVVIGSDREMHNLLDDTVEQIVEIDYPIHLLTYDGEIVEVEDNEELEEEIEDAAESCDEDDEIEDDEYEEEDENYED